MAEDFEPVTTAVPAISHRGILIIMTVLVTAGAIAGFAVRGINFGLGVIFGGLLSLGNYYWLERITRAIFNQTAVASTWRLAVKYILRYAVIGGILLLVFLTDALPMIAVILGLAAFALAVVIQGLKNIVSSSL